MITKITTIITKRADLDWFLVYNCDDHNCDEEIVFSKTNDSLKIFRLLEIGTLIERELND